MDIFFQGFFLFLFHCFLDKKVRYMYIAMLFEILWYLFNTMIID